MMGTLVHVQMYTLCQVDRCLDDFHHDCAVLRGRGSVEIVISVFEYIHIAQIASY